LAKREQQQEERRDKAFIVSILGLHPRASMATEKGTFPSPLKIHYTFFVLCSNKTIVTSNGHS
jgi:hypothetical protein